jgi:hypothetical protein
MIERYIGLTYANQSKNEKAGLADTELFRISKNNNFELAAICLDRRNQKRLSFIIKGRVRIFYILSINCLKLVRTKKQSAI